MCSSTLKIGILLFIFGNLFASIGKKTYFLDLGTIPVTGVGLYSAFTGSGSLLLLRHF